MLSNSLATKFDGLKTIAPKLLFLYTFSFS